MKGIVLTSPKSKVKINTYKHIANLPSNTYCMPFTCFFSHCDTGLPSGHLTCPCKKCSEENLAPDRAAPAAPEVVGQGKTAPSGIPGRSKPRSLNPQTHLYIWEFSLYLGRSMIAWNNQHVESNGTISLSVPRAGKVLTPMGPLISPDNSWQNPLRKCSRPK